MPCQFVEAFSFPAFGDSLGGWTILLQGHCTFDHLQALEAIFAAFHIVFVA